MLETASPVKSRWPALIVLCVGMLMIILDQTIVNVALPAIKDDLGFSQTRLAWVVNAYLIGFGGILLLAGRLGDLIGRERMFLAGLAVFTIASVACGWAWNQEVLIAARFVQGVGGAMTASVILGVIVTMFPAPAEQAKAIGIYSFVAAAGASIGLLAGGVLTQALSWEWIFLVNVPFGIGAGVFATRVLTFERGPGLREGADVTGAALITSGLMLGVYSIVEVAEVGWGSTRTILLGGLAVILLAGFVLRQARAAAPLLPLRVFRSRNVTGANLVQMFMVAGLLGMFFVGTLFLQRVLGYGALRIGLAFLPVAIGIGLLSVGMSARLNARFGPRAVLLTGLTLIAAGLALMSRAPADAGYLTDLLPVMLLLGVGGGMSFPALMSLAMSDATGSDSGLASGLVNTTQQVGGALGLAVLATLASLRTEGLVAEGAGAGAALLDGYRLAFTVASGLVVVALVIAATVLRRGTVAVAEDANPRQDALPRSQDRDLAGHH